jgi:hypothetical protein
MSKEHLSNRRIRIRTGERYRVRVTRGNLALRIDSSDCNSEGAPSYHTVRCADNEVIGRRWWQGHRQRRGPAGR